MKKIIGSVMVMAALACAGSVSAENLPVRIYVYAVNGPSEASSDYLTFATNVVNDIYSNGSPSGALGYRLNPMDVMQPTADNSNSVWFAVRVVADKPSVMFTPSMLRFIGRSSDGGNILGKTNVFTDPTYIYTPQALGIIWGQDGPRFSDTLVTSGSWSTQPVNEFVFVGARSKFIKYTNATEQDALVTLINSWPDFSVTGTWEYMTNNMVVQHSSKTLRTKSFPTLGILDNKVAGLMQRVGVTANTNDTWTLQFSEKLPASWSDVATVNGGDTFERSNVGQGFFRLMLQ